MARHDGSVQQMGDRAVVLDHPLDRFPADRFRPSNAGIAFLQLGHDAEGLDVVIEPAPRLHLGLQLVLAGMAERRMAQVVGQGHGLGQVGVQPQRMGQRAGDLGHLQTVGQAGAVVVAFVGDEDLGLALQAAKGRGSG